MPRRSSLRCTPSSGSTSANGYRGEGAGGNVNPMIPNRTARKSVSFATVGGDRKARHG